MATTDQKLLQQIQYAVIEPPDGGQSWPSQLWTRDEVLGLANQRQDRFLHDTLLLVGIAILSPVNIGDHSIALPADWTRTVSLVWRGNDGIVRELQRVDTFEADHAIPTWFTTNGVPLFYMEDDVPSSGVVQFGPAPTVAGTLELLYVPLGTPLNGNGEILVVPDECAHVIKYAVLADMLSKDGRGRKPAEAEYCEQRVTLAKQAVDLILEGWA